MMRVGPMQTAEVAVATAGAPPAGGGQLVPISADLRASHLASRLNFKVNSKHRLRQCKFASVKGSHRKLC